MTEVPTKKRRVLPWERAAGSDSVTQPLRFTGQVEYISCTEQAEKIALLLVRQRSQSTCVFGFDIEWRVTYVAGQAPRKTALLQLSDANTAYLFHIIHFSEFPLSLIALINSKDILKVGVGIRNDMLKLQGDYRELQPAGVVDLADMARDCPSCRSCATFSLANLVDTVLGRVLPKPSNLRTGNWENRPLSAEQIEYAGAFSICYHTWSLAFIFSLFPNTYSGGRIRRLPSLHATFS
jgi:hypothetical protein